MSQHFRVGSRPQTPMVQVALEDQRRPPRRLRRRRLYWLPFGVLACANVSATFALSRVVAPLLAVPLGVLLYSATVWRFFTQMRDKPRPRWITVFVDQPLFMHFGASVFGLLLSPVCLVCALLAVALSHVSLFGFWREALCAAYALGMLLSVYAIWIERRFVRVRQLEVQIANLPTEFDGYRIAQLSDLHVGSFDPKRRALEWVALSNSLDADLATVTGDLVTNGTGFYADVADGIAALRAKDGVFVSMGNHDQSNNDELCRLVAERGPTVLRNESRVIRRGQASLVVAGLDGRIASPADAARVVRSCATGAPMVLLSHYPWTFEAVAAAGVDLVLTGHTHGGQLAVPFFSQRFNLARLTRQLSRGLYHSGKTTMYVNAGLGTTGPPMRLAVPPEIALFTLRRAES
ncbi:MAG: metallophosphoesterase [Polyangiaceae bacterium]